MAMTKTDYLYFKQCSKSLWLAKNKTDVLKKEEVSLDERDELVNLAAGLFVGGRKILGDTAEKIAYTKEALDKGVQTIYGASFQTHDFLINTDILRRTDKGWDLYKVTSSTGIKERQLDDLAYQYTLLTHHLPITSVQAIHLNKEYVRQGILDVNQLFIVQDVTEEVHGRFDDAQQTLNEMLEVVNEDAVEVEIGNHCTKYGKEACECPAKAFCWSAIPEYSVFNIPRIGKKALELYQKGIVRIEDVPDDFKLTDAQKVTVDMYKTKQDIVDKQKIREFLRDFTFPLYFLDFETYQQTIPLYDGIKPYQQVPFQYSLHIMTSYFDELEHKEYLAKEGTDSRRELAEQLVRDIPKDVCVVAYNMSFEKSVIKNLSEMFLDLADHLMNIHDNFVDLMIPFQKKWYYLNAMKGSYSIKYVLPALIPNDDKLDYKQLAIQNGSMAMDIFARLHTYPPEQIKEIRQQLKAYCGLDTYAMVRIFEFLYLL